MKKNTPIAIRLKEIKQPGKKNMKQENYEQPEIVCILLPSRFQTKPGGTNLPLVIQYDCLDMLRTVDSAVFSRELVFC